MVKLKKKALFLFCDSNTVLKLQFPNLSLPHSWDSRPVLTSLASAIFSFKCPLCPP